MSVCVLVDFTYIFSLARLAQVVEHPDVNPGVKGWFPARPRCFRSNWSRNVTYDHLPSTAPRKERNCKLLAEQCALSIG